MESRDRVVSVYKHSKWAGAIESVVRSFSRGWKCVTATQLPRQGWWSRRRVHVRRMMLRNAFSKHLRGLTPYGSLKSRNASTWCCSTNPLFCSADALRNSSPVGQFRLLVNTGDEPLCRQLNFS